MLYQAYQANDDVLAPIRLVAEATRGFLSHPWPFFGNHPLMRGAAAACEMVSRFAVSEEAVVHHPFCTLLHFAKDSKLTQPRVLVVAPLSGHFATLLRGTVETLLPDHDVYITDWVNARNVPLVYGRFDLDNFIDLVIGFLHELGPRTHVVAVCQPSVPVLAAVALMAADRDKL